MQEVCSRIPTLYTIETPIRSVAYANHCVWVEQVRKNLQEGCECAIYYEPYANRETPCTLDAIYIEIVTNQKGYNVDGFAIIPDMERQEIKINEWHTNYANAKQAANNWLWTVHELYLH